jgi:uncharacterized alkaline shock family protein YloU
MANRQRKKRAQEGGNMVEEKHELMLIELEMEPRLAEIGEFRELKVGGVTAIDDEVIGAIAGVAAREVEGIASVGTSSIRRTLVERLGRAEPKARGVAVEAGRKEAILDLTVKVIYGFSIPALVIDVRKAVASRLLDLVGLVAKEININVVGIEFPERMPGRVA